MYEALIIIFRKQLQTKKDPDLTGDGSTTLPRMVTNRQQDIKKITKNKSSFTNVYDLGIITF